MEEPRFEACFACGQSNPVGLKLCFSYSDGKACATFCSSSSYEGYPGIVHGGIISTLMDEAMAKAILMQGRRAVTANLTTHFRLPLATGVQVNVSGWITELKSRTIKAAAQVIDADSNVIATAEAVFIIVKSPA